MAPATGVRRRCSSIAATGGRGGILTQPASVADAGAGWIDRFRALAQRLEVKRLDGLPDWLEQESEGGYTIWQRSNRWILHTALSRADVDVTLIVLWDGKGGDGPGGTENMVTSPSHVASRP